LEHCIFLYTKWKADWRDNAILRQYLKILVLHFDNTIFQLSAKLLEHMNFQSLIRLLDINSQIQVNIELLSEKFHYETALRELQFYAMYFVDEKDRFMPVEFDNRTLLTKVTFACGQLVKVSQIPQLLPNNNSTTASNVITIDNGKHNDFVKSINQLTISEKQNTSNSSTDKMCSICLSHKIEIVFIPCGHVCVCFGCCGKLAKCPICRTNITLKNRIYIG